VALDFSISDRGYISPLSKLFFSFFPFFFRFTLFRTMGHNDTWFIGLKLLSVFGIGCIGSSLIYLPTFFKNVLNLSTDKVGFLYSISKAPHDMNDWLNDSLTHTHSLSLLFSTVYILYLLSVLDFLS
jgi:hypothetical protein